MKNVFYAENPLILNPRLSREFGVVPALILQQLHYWLEKSKHVHDGRRWVYNTIATWHDQIPVYKNPESMRRAFVDLERRGLIVSANYNTDRYDRTKWYSINYDAVGLAMSDEEVSEEEKEAPIVKCNTTKSSAHITTKSSAHNPTKSSNTIAETTTETTTETSNVRTAHVENKEIHNHIKSSVDIAYTQSTGQTLPWKTKAAQYVKQIKQIEQLCDYDVIVFERKLAALIEKAKTDKWYKEQGVTFGLLISQWEKLRTAEPVKQYRQPPPVLKDEDIPDWILKATGAKIEKKKE